MTINARTLSWELEKANIPNAGCNSKGVVWDLDGVTEIQERPDVAAVIASHNPELDLEELRNEIKRVASLDLKNTPNWATWTIAEATDYINNNTANMNEARVIIVALTKMVFVLRDYIFADIVVKQRN